MSGEVFTCEICKEAVHKYKCPKCLLKYCSVSCYKLHKENGCNPEKVKEVKKQEGLSALPDVSTTNEETCTDEESFDTEDRVPPGLLAKLGESEELKVLLENPGLTNIISQIDCAQKPDLAIVKAMQNPVFTEFADKCLAIVEPQNNMPESVKLYTSHSDSD